MKSMFRMIVTLLLLAGWTLAGLALHVARLPDGYYIGVLPKDHLTLFDTYVDVRAWTPADVPAHADFVKRVLSANHTDWLKGLTDPTKGDATAQLTDMLTPAPPPATAPAKAEKTHAASNGRAK